MSATKTIKVGYIARVEGQGSLDIKLKIFEPPRFFEAFLVGRKYDEVHELASRICGICPVAHQITALLAVENAIGLEVSQQTRDLREILALSAIINSHVLSLYFLTAPDYLKHESAISMGKEYPELLKRGLKLKKLGNDIGDIIGGRAIHPVFAVLNGFTNIPARDKLDAIKERLIDARGDALETVKFFGSLEYPDLTRQCEHIAISDTKKYAINEGIMKSTNGLIAKGGDYRKFIEETQILYSNAKGSTVKGRGTFLVGPLARVNINFDKLSDNAKGVAGEIGFNTPRFNPFDSIIARSIEVVHAIDECIELINGLPLKEEDISYSFSPGDGSALTEAPRGMLYHSYRINKDGLVESADIVPPTAHNVRNIERDLKELVLRFNDLSRDDLTLKCEMLIRAYDPCISCSVH